jgi:ABC-type antimicrobial peptide transport system permease subunit
MSAFDIGVKNIKKRKLRLALTLLSIIFIVIGLICTSSIKSISKTVYWPNPTEVPYNGVFLQRYLYGAENIQRGLFGIGCNILKYCEVSYENIATVTYRSWLYSGVEPSVSPIPVFLEDGRLSNVSAVLGLSHNDPLAPTLKGALTGRWFEPFDTWSVILSEKKAQSLSLKIGDTIILYGLKFVIIGFINDDALLGIKEVNEEQITPLWFSGIQVYNLHLFPESVAIIPSKTLNQMGGTIISISVEFNNTYFIEESKKLSEIFTDYDIYAISNGTAYYSRRTTNINILGWQTQIIPIIIGSLTILNLMLSMMFERKHEISIFSIVGLSPIQISIMFLAEVLCFAIVGGLIGYFGAIATIYLNRLLYPNSPATFNYASMGAIVSVGISIAMTIASVSYPLIKISKFVTPSLMRHWKVPTQPRGDEWEIPFPFIVETDQEARSLASFLMEFFSHHKGERAAIFTVRDLNFEEYVKDEKNVMSIIVNMNVSPYELGIIQEMRILIIRSSPTRREIVVFIRIISGPRESWIANNYYVLDSLRKQFLIWRSLGKEEREGYNKK